MTPPGQPIETEHWSDGAAPPGGGRHEGDGPGRPLALSPREFGRWAWRQLTSMRTALLLLLLLAVAAVPGSLVPQRGVDPLKAARFRLENPSLSPWFDRLGLFSVYSSPWFAAIYLLLVVSLIGCVVPRSAAYARALAARPPPTPARLERLPAYVTYETDRPVGQVLTDAGRLLRRRRFRVDTDHEGDRGSVRAEKGYLREAGNLVFHTSLLAVLIGVAIGSLGGYRGGTIVAEGGTFSNTRTQYDDFASGALVNDASLPPFSLQLDDMAASFVADGPQAGQPSLFRATGTVVDSPGASPEPFDIQVNHPFTVDGASVFLIGSGYAPKVTVRDGQGNVVASGPVPFLPTDASYVSEGVIKVPDARPAQLGIEGYFLPTAATAPNGAPISVFPEAVNPTLDLLVWTGDLGLDKGLPQSVYSLNKDDLTLVDNADGTPVRLMLQPGETARLPDGLGTVTFDGVAEFARLQIGREPVAWLPLAGLVTALVGMMLSLYVQPRRVWVRATKMGRRTQVEVAGLNRRSDGRLAADIQSLVEQLRGPGVTAP